MTADRDKFAVDIYLRLLEARPNTTEEWRREEAIRQADAFVEELERNKEPAPSRAPRKRQVAKV